jgi:hypothetical protein
VLPPKTALTKQKEDPLMARKDLVALYGRLGLIVAAFALVAGIIGGPLLQRIWSPHRMEAEQRDGSALRMPKPPVTLAAEKQG